MKVQISSIILKKQNTKHQHAARRESPGGPRQDLAWSSTLAAAAERYAKELARRNRGLKHEDQNTVGENLAQSTGYIRSNPEAVRAWISEKKYYHGEPIGTKKKSKKEQVGHYLQVIFKPVTKVGMAIVTSGKETYNVARYDKIQMEGERPWGSATMIPQVQDHDKIKEKEQAKQKEKAKGIIKTTEIDKTTRNEKVKVGENAKTNEKKNAKAEEKESEKAKVVTKENETTMKDRKTMEDRKTTENGQAKDNSQAKDKEETNETVAKRPEIAMHKRAAPPKTLLKGILKKPTENEPSYPGQSTYPATEPSRPNEHRPAVFNDSPGARPSPREPSPRRRVFEEVSLWEYIEDSISRELAEFQR
ncbi:uncharacterized protein RCO7_06478 [Rhynchosporium graminicola]|uniref:SCP domain-containing protein n=1 Tax=Rhynchosporium graminicola TaxID=2792576 RepID=A0A1E1KA76_9HELO|nr:uncharacterized protein RCO7_06478 [Rhynchosporium commune]